METHSFSLAKITQPQVGGVLLRETLFAKLDTYRKKPITWIVGPGGSGKTTLLSSYIETRKLPCLWFQIDAGDSDPSNFFYYLGLAGQKASPHIHKPLPLFTPEYFLGIPEFSRTFFGDLFGRLRPSFLVVFDNYHEADENSPIHQAIIEGLSRLPEGISLVLVSRSAPTPDYSRWLANRQMGTMGWDDLRLSFEECQAIHAIKGKSISALGLKEIYRWVDGWAAGLILLLESGVTEIKQNSGAPKRTPEEVFNYFACEVFERQKTFIKEFLLKTSFFPYMTSGMAEEFTENHEAARILAALNRYNNFTERRIQKHVTYQYHPLFREFLQNRARTYYGEKHLSELKGHAAAILLDSEQKEAAVGLLCETEDWQSLASLILKQAEILIQQGRNRVLETWITMLPEKQADNNPWLLFWLAVSRVPFNPQESKVLFKKAFEGFTENRDRIGIFLSWSGVSESIFYCFTGFDEYDQWLEKFDKIVKKYTPYPSPEIEARITVSVLHAIVFRQPFHKDHETYTNRAAELIDSDISTGAKVQLHHILCISQTFAHNYIRAEFFIKSFKSFNGSASVPPMAILIQRQTEALFLWMVARFEECRKVVRENFKLVSECGIHLFDHFLLSNAVSAALSQGDVKSAEPNIERMQAAIGYMNDWAKSWFYTLLAWRDVINADFEQAGLHVNKSHELAGYVCMPTTLGYIKVWRSFVYHLLGDYEQSDKYLHETENHFKLMNIESSYYDFYLHKAYIDLDRGREQQGLQALGNCFRIARKFGYVNHDYWWSPMMVRLCTRALQEGIEVEYVRQLIRKRGLVPEDPSLAEKNWPWPVRIYTMGRFEIVLDDKALRFVRKAQQKPIDLLQVLIALGGRKISDTKIVDILWPDDDGDMQMQSLHSTVYRLRKLLRHKDAVDYRDGRLSLNNRMVWVDVWTFERLLGEAEILFHKKPKLRQVEQLRERLFSLYQNAFLSQLTDRYWTVKLREKLKSKFLRFIEKLGKYYADAGLFEEAISLYRKALEVDPFLESCYQQIMLSYINLGQTSEVINTYRSCTTMLKSGLGVEPCQETKKIYDKLRNAAKKNEK